MHNKNSQKDLINLLVQAFNFFDRDGSGTISKEELHAVLKIDNPDITEEIVEYMIQEVDLNNDGTVSFDEFIKMMKVIDDSGSSPINIQIQKKNSGEDTP
jgi:Ca2+-binding EF-hand superfamily protein